MRTAEILDEDILNIFKYQGMATSKQIADLLNISYTKANRVSKKLWEREARLINRTTEKRLWNVDTNRAGAPEYLYYLNEAGAHKVTELTGDKITAPSMLIKKNITHAIALVDIVSICIKMGGIVRVNRRIYSSEDAETYIRPDIEYSPKGEKKYFIEFEQSRVKLDLENKILERMRRWQKILTKEQGNDQYFKEIFVLFNLEETDNYTLRIWAKAYETLYKELNTPPEFIVWYKPFKEFYTAPSFNLNEYTRLTMGDVHISTILAEEKKKDIVRLTNRPVLDKAAIDQRMDDYFEENREAFHQLQKNDETQRFFFEEVVRLYQMATCYDDDYQGFAQAATPYLSINLVRTWLECPDLIGLRAALIDAIANFQASYARGLNAAGASLERMIWNVLFRYFGFDRYGPLSCTVQIGSNDQVKDRSNDLIFTVSISTPWNGVCEDSTAGKETERALTWFINMLFRYNQELGLVKDRRKKWAGD